MHQTLVTVIIPAFNCENDIEKCIHSILSSTHENLEILVCDDASRDQTWKRLQQFKDNKKIHLFRLDENKGVAWVRNDLLAKATGEYIVMQDADDFSDPLRISKQLQYLTDNPRLSGVGTWAYLVDSNLKKWGGIHVQKKPTWLTWYLQKSMVHASIMLRRKVAISASYPSGLRFGEDYAYLTSLYNYGHGFENIQESLYFYKIEKSEIKTRALRNFKEILISRWVISRSFSFPKRALFLILSLLSVGYSFGRGLINLLTK